MGLDCSGTIHIAVGYCNNDEDQKQSHNQNIVSETDQDELTGLRSHSPHACFINPTGLIIAIVTALLLEVTEFSFNQLRISAEMQIFADGKCSQIIVLTLHKDLVSIVDESRRWVLMVAPVFV